MPTNTTNQGIQLPTGPDPADGPTAFVNQTAGFEGRLVQRYLSIPDRAARNPAPATNEMSILSGNTYYDRWTGAKWLPTTPIQVMKTTTQTVNNSVTLVNDTELVVPVPAVAATYLLEGSVVYVSSTVADFKCTFAVNANITTFSFYPIALATSAGGTSGDVTTQGTTTLGTTISLGGSGGTAGFQIAGRITTNGTATTLQFQWAQNALDATNTQVFGSSWMRLTAFS